MNPTYRAGILLAIGVLGLSACGTDEKSDASDPAASTTSPTGSPSGPPLTCPSTLSYVNYTGQEAAAPAVESVPLPAEAIVCSYTQTGSDDSSGWTASGEPIVLDEKQRTALFEVLSWKPQPVDQPCTTDIGPVHALSWRATDGTTAALAVEDFGCRNAYALKDLTSVALAGPVTLAQPAWEQLAALTP